MIVRLINKKHIKNPVNPKIEGKPIMMTLELIKKVFWYDTKKGSKQEYWIADIKFMNENEIDLLKKDKDVKVEAKKKTKKEEK